MLKNENSIYDKIINSDDKYSIIKKYITKIDNQKELCKLFDFLVVNNIEIDRSLKYCLNCVLDYQFYFNIHKYAKVFEHESHFIEFILYNKRYNKFLNEFLAEFSTNPITLIFYLDKKLYNLENIDISLYDIFDNMVKSNNNLSKHYKKQLLYLLFDIDYYLNRKVMEDVLKIISHKEIYNYLMKETQHSILDLVVTFKDNIEMKYVDKDRSPIIQCLKLFKKYNITIDIDQKSIDKYYIYSLIYDIYNIYKHDKDNLFRFLLENKNDILKKGDIIDNISLDIIYDLYDIDKDLTKWLIKHSNLSLQKVFNYLDRSDVNDKFIKIFYDYIIEFPDYYLDKYIFFNKQLIDKLYFENSKEINVNLLKIILNNIEIDNVQSEYINYSPYLSFISNRYNEIYYFVNDDLFKKHNRVLNFYIPKSDSRDEQEKVKTSINGIINFIKKIDNDKKRFIIVKNLKNYINTISNIEIDFKNISIDV